MTNNESIIWLVNHNNKRYTIFDIVNSEEAETFRDKNSDFYSKKGVSVELAVYNPNEFLEKQLRADREKDGFKLTSLDKLYEEVKTFCTSEQYLLIGWDENLFIDAQKKLSNANIKFDSYFVSATFLTKRSYISQKFNNYKTIIVADDEKRLFNLISIYTDFEYGIYNNNLILLNEFIERINNEN